MVKQTSFSLINGMGLTMLRSLLICLVSTLSLSISEARWTDNQILAERNKFVAKEKSNTTKFVISLADQAFKDAKGSKDRLDKAESVVHIFTSGRPFGFKKKAEAKPIQKEMYYGLYKAVKVILDEGKEDILDQYFKWDYFNADSAVQKHKSLTWLFKEAVIAQAEKKLPSQIESYFDLSFNIPNAVADFWLNDNTLLKAKYKEQYAYIQEFSKIKPGGNTNGNNNCPAPKPGEDTVGKVNQTGLFNLSEAGVKKLQEYMKNPTQFFLDISKDLNSSKKLLSQKTSEEEVSVWNDFTKEYEKKTIRYKKEDVIRNSISYYFATVFKDKTDNRLIDKIKLKDNGAIEITPETMDFVRGIKTIYGSDFNLLSKLYFEESFPQTSMIKYYYERAKRKDGTVDYVKVRNEMQRSFDKLFEEFVFTYLAAIDKNRLFDFFVDATPDSVSCSGVLTGKQPYFLESLREGKKTFEGMVKNVFENNNGHLDNHLNSIIEQWLYEFLVNSDKSPNKEHTKSLRNPNRTNVSVQDDIKAIKDYFGPDKKAFIRQTKEIFIKETKKLLIEKLKKHIQNIMRLSSLQKMQLSDLQKMQLSDLQEMRLSDKFFMQSNFKIRMINTYKLTDAVSNLSEYSLAAVQYADGKILDDVAFKDDKLNIYYIYKKDHFGNFIYKMDKFGNFEYEKDKAGYYIKDKDGSYVKVKETMKLSDSKASLDDDGYVMHPILDFYKRNALGKYYLKTVPIKHPEDKYTKIYEFTENIPGFTYDAFSDNNMMIFFGFKPSLYLKKFVDQQGNVTLTLNKSPLELTEEDIDFMQIWNLVGLQNVKDSSYVFLDDYLSVKYDEYLGD